MYIIVLKKSAQKELSKISKTYYKSIKDAIDNLAYEPRPDGCKKLSGNSDNYRIRVGAYRVVYTIEDNILKVSVIKVGHRKDIYKNI